MSISVARDQSWVSRLPQASTVQRVPPVQKVLPQAGGTTAPSADPRALSALTDVLSVFLQQINGAAAAPQATPATTDDPRETLGQLKDDFDGLLERLGSAAGGAEQDADAATRLKADVSDFVSGLLKATEHVTKAMMAPAPVAQTTAVAAVEPKQDNVMPIRANLPDATSAYAENAAFVPKPAEESVARSSSLFSSLGARFQRHFEEL